MDLSLALTQGFRNAPRLYGDTTVRPPPRISGIQSGLRAAGAEFTTGIYDGVTGLFSQPYHGAREGGTLGFAQGVGKGLGGFILKDLAAITAPFGYTMKGMHMEIIKGRQPTKLVRRARIQQGTIDFVELKEAERKQQLAKVNASWKAVQRIRRQNDLKKQEGIQGRVKSFGQQSNTRNRNSSMQLQKA